MMSQSSERSIYGFKCSQGRKNESHPAAYPGRALWVAANSLLHNHNKTKIKKKEENPIRKGGPSEYSGGFSLCRSRIRESCSFLIWVLEIFMAFFTSAIGILKTLVVAIGAGLAVWGVINLLEGYGNDNPGANAHVW